MLYHLSCLGNCGGIWFTPIWGCRGSILTGRPCDSSSYLRILFATSCTVGTRGEVVSGWFCRATTLDSKLLSLLDSPYLLGLPSLNSSMLSSNLSASFMHVFSVLCFLGYRAAWSLGFSNPSKKSDTSHSWLGISILGHLKRYFFNLFKEFFTVSVSSYLKL